MTTSELHMANRALAEADEALQAYWSRPQSDLDSRIMDLEVIASALTRSITVMLLVVERYERVRS